MQREPLWRQVCECVCAHPLGVVVPVSLHTVRFLSLARGGNTASGAPWTRNQVACQRQTMRRALGVCCRGRYMPQ